MNTTSQADIMRNPGWNDVLNSLKKVSKKVVDIADDPFFSILKEQLLGIFANGLGPGATFYITLDVVAAFRQNHVENRIMIADECIGCVSPDCEFFFIADSMGQMYILTDTRQIPGQENSATEMICLGISTGPKIDSEKGLEVTLRMFTADEFLSSTVIETLQTITMPLEAMGEPVRLPTDNLPHATPTDFMCSGIPHVPPAGAPDFNATPIPDRLPSPPSLVIGQYKRACDIVRAVKERIAHPEMAWAPSSALDLIKLEYELDYLLTQLKYYVDNKTRTYADMTGDLRAFLDTVNAVVNKASDFLDNSIRFVGGKIC